MQATATASTTTVKPGAGLLQNRRALVTGASTGIGADFARRLAQLGCNLILVARGESKMRELAAEITRAYPVAVDVFALDLAEPRAADRLYQQVTAAGLDVDVLVNNAGLGLYGDFADQPLDKIREMLQVNIFTLTDLTRLFVPQMRARRFGRIIEVGSIASFMPGPGYGAYSASKAYVLSLGESLNLELKGTGVSCTVVCPGMTQTNFFDVAGHTEKSLYKRLVMMRSHDVARIGIDRALKGKSKVVTGWHNWFQVFGSHFLPNRIGYLIAQLMMKLK
jgi:short-subunit dehydrogenase